MENTGSSRAFNGHSCQTGGEKMSDITDACPKCGAEMGYDKVSDVSVLGGDLWVDLHIHACPECGYIDDKETWCE